MNDLQIVFATDPRLKKESRPVDGDEFGEELESHMSNMAKKMYELGGMGLAGVQVGDLRQILVMDSQDESGGLLKVVNPIIIEKSEDNIITAEEGCLSLPGFETEVPRHVLIKVQYYDTNGRMHLDEFYGIQSIIIQHEMDHFDGVTLLNKVSRLKRDMYTRKIKKIKKKLKRLSGR